MKVPEISLEKGTSGGRKITIWLLYEDCFIFSKSFSINDEALSQSISYGFYMAGC